MTKDETLALAGRHIAAGRKIVLAFRGARPIGYVLRRWSASDFARPQPEEIIEDQPLVIVREVDYQEYLAQRPPEFGPVEHPPRAGSHYYELKCE